MEGDDSTIADNSTIDGSNYERPSTAGTVDDPEQIDGALVTLRFVVNEEFILQGHRKAITRLRVLDHSLGYSSTLLVSISEDLSIRVWNTISYKVIKCFCRSIVKEIVSVVTLRGHPDFLVVASIDTIYWLKMDGEALIEVNALIQLDFAEGIQEMEASVDGTILYVGDEDGTIMVIDLDPETGYPTEDASPQKPYALYRVHSSIVGSLMTFPSESATGSSLVTGGFECCVKLLDISTNGVVEKCVTNYAMIQQLEGQMVNPPFPFALKSLDERCLVAAFGDGRVRLLRKADLVEVGCAEEAHNAAATCISICNGFIVSGGKVQLYNLPLISQLFFFLLSRYG